MLSGMTRVMLSDNDDTVSSSGGETVFFSWRTVMEFPVIDTAGTGANIKALVKKSGKTVAEVGRILMVSDKSVIYKWFRGDALPGIDNLYALSILLGVTVNDIIVTK